MRVPSSVAFFVAAAELANQTAHSDILAESFHKKHAFLGLLDGEVKSKAKSLLGLDFDLQPHLHQPKALVWLSRLSARMCECAVCTSSAAATDRAMTEGTCGFCRLV